MSDEAHLMRLVIGYEALLAVLNGTLTIQNLDLPTDAKIVEIYNESAHRGFTLIVQSQFFEAVPLGQMLPSLAPFGLAFKPRE